MATRSPWVMRVAGFLVGLGLLAVPTAALACVLSSELPGVGTPLRAVAVVAGSVLLPWGLVTLLTGPLRRALGARPSWGLLNLAVTAVVQLLLARSAADVLHVGPEAASRAFQQVMGTPGGWVPASAWARVLGRPEAPAAQPLVTPPRPPATPSAQEEVARAVANAPPGSIFLWTDEDGSVHLDSQRPPPTAIRVKVEAPSNRGPSPSPSIPDAPRAPSAALTPEPSPKAAGEPGWSAVEREVLSLTNQRRAAGATCDGQAFPPAGALEPDDQLQRAARGHSEDMLARSFFSHDTPEGRSMVDRARAAGFQGMRLGENIARGQQTAADVVEAWMKSPGHCRNIMNAGMRVLGVGQAQGGFKGPSWTQDFGG